MPSETKNLSCKLPIDLHRQITAEIQVKGITISEFIAMVINEHYDEKKGGNNMATRTMAFQVSEELFQRIKEYLSKYEQVYHRKLTQKEFVLGLIEQALDEADEDFAALEAAKQTEQEEEPGWEVVENQEPDDDTPAEEENEETESEDTVSAEEEEPAPETEEIE